MVVFSQSKVCFFWEVSCDHVYLQIIYFLIKLRVFAVKRGRSSSVDPDGYYFSVTVHLFDKLGGHVTYLQVTTTALAEYHFGFWSWYIVVKVVYI
jgi:hypothetical protein